MGPHGVDFACRIYGDGSHVVYDVSGVNDFLSELFTIIHFLYFIFVYRIRNQSTFTRFRVSVRSKFLNF